MVFFSLLQFDFLNLSHLLVIISLLLASCHHLNNRNHLLQNHHHQISSILTNFVINQMSPVLPLFALVHINHKLINKMPQTLLDNFQD